MSVAAASGAGKGGRPAVFAVLVVMLTLVRLIGLHLSVVDLFFDESQYWAWAQAPAFGYFSKPPLLAWIITASQTVCGASEACIRAPAPLLHGATAFLIYAIGQRLFSARAGFWSGLIYLLAPGVVFSTRIISTDVPLLFCWALALLAFVELRRAPNWGWAVLLGLAIGIGMLAKYAMIYFVACAVLAAIMDEGSRRLWRRPQLWVALAIGVVVLAPNLMWNAANGFVTLKHTGDNARGNGLMFSLPHAAEFVASQFAVMGFITFGVFLALLVRPRHYLRNADMRMLMAFAVPPVAIITVVAFLTHANANWAAPSAIAMTILATAVLVTEDRRVWLVASIVIGLVVQGTLLVGDHIADRVSIPGIRNGDVYARTMGWHRLSDDVAVTAKAHGARGIAADTRDLVSSLIYYTRTSGLPVLAWPLSAVPSHEFDISRPLTAAASMPILFVTECELPARLEAQFGNVTSLGPVTMVRGPTSRRSFSLFLLDQPKGALRPLAGCS
jgi:hypothetical protein